MITRISSVIRPKGSDLIFDHPYNVRFWFNRVAAASRLSSRATLPESITVPWWEGSTLRYGSA
jgi:hypothetical protein